MFPSERRDVGQEFGRDVEAGVLPGEDGLTELPRVPVDDDRGQQVEAGEPVVLSFLGSVSQFATLVEIDGALESMLLPGSNCLSQTNRVTPASTVSSSRCSRSRRSPGGTRSAMRASIRRSASTSASAQIRSIVVVAGRMVRV